MEIREQVKLGIKRKKSHKTENYAIVELGGKGKATILVTIG